MIHDRTELAVSWIESNCHRLMAQHIRETAQKPATPTLAEWLRQTSAERQIGEILEGLDPAVRCCLGSDAATPHLHISTGALQPGAAITSLLSALADRQGILVTTGQPARPIPAALRIPRPTEGDLLLHPSSLRVSLYPGLTHVHILVHIPEAIPLHAPELKDIAYALIERLLGEEVTRQSIGAIEIAPIGARIRDLAQHPLLELPRLVAITSDTVRNRYLSALKDKTLADLQLRELGDTVESILAIPPGSSAMEYTLVRVSWWSPRPSETPVFTGILEAAITRNPQVAPPVLGDGRIYELIGRVDPRLDDDQRRGLVCDIVETISQTQGVIIDMAGWYPMVLEQMVELATSLIDDNFTASAEALLRLSLQLAEHDDHLISRVQLLLLITSQISGNEPLAKEAIDWLQTHGRDEDLHQLHEIRGLHQEHLANFTSALNEYQTALTFPEINAPVCRYHMARCQISLGNVDATILLLQECFSEAPQFQERFLQDPAFVLYRGDPAFSPLISSLKGSMM